MDGFMRWERRWLGASIDDRKDRGASSWKEYRSVLILESWKNKYRLWTREVGSDGTTSVSFDNSMTTH